MAANHDQRRLHEVLDGGAFAEKLGIRDNRSSGFDVRCDHFIAATGKDRTADYDGERLGTAVEMIADLGRHATQVIQIEVAIGRRGRADTEEGEVGVAQGVFRRLGRGKASAGKVLGDQRLQSRLEERRVAVENGLYFASVDIDTDNTAAEIGKTCSCNTTNVSETKNGDSGLIRHKGILGEFLVSGFWRQVASSQFPAGASIRRAPAGSFISRPH